MSSGVGTWMMRQCLPGQLRYMTIIWSNRYDYEVCLFFKKNWTFAEQTRLPSEYSIYFLNCFYLIIGTLETLCNIKRIKSAFIQPIRESPNTLLWCCLEIGRRRSRKASNSSYYALWCHLVLIADGKEYGSFFFSLSLWFASHTNGKLHSPFINRTSKHVYQHLVWCKAVKFSMSLKRGVCCTIFEAEFWSN